ncbi:HAF family protein [Pseudomonas gingeri]|uniref:HAF family protein n=1 Tax=Pseudomonas gingeri TaxID=117681 RepID=UPI0015A20018|nr:HAF family protein [Pseudomonas gingeri]NWA28332.1 HAF family protein [Pseudomonas gingeri]
MKTPSRLVTSLGLIIAGVSLATTAQAATWSDDVYNVTLTNSNITGINDTKLSIGNSIGADFVHLAIYDTASGGGTALPPLFTSSAGVPGACAGGAVSNGSATTAVLIGSCEDGTSIPQAVKWVANNLTAPPQQQLPLPLLAGLRLVPDVQTEAAAVNLAGVVVGVSISPSGETTPVIWTSAGAANSLLPPLLGSVTNCSTADISDAATPSIIGNCPAGSGGAGKNQAVLWSSASSGYTALPVPTGASYCVASEINLSGQILGTCYYIGSGSSTPDTYKTVQWAAGGGSAPTVMLTINGSTSLRNSGTAMNASGQITGNRLKSGGFVTGFVWNPSTGTDGTPIPLLPGSSRATAKAISNNGVAVGCGEVGGLSQAYVYHISSGTLTAITALGAGGNDCANAISPAGAYTAGLSENATIGEQDDGVITSTP